MNAFRFLLAALLFPCVVSAAEPSLTIAISKVPVKARVDAGVSYRFDGVCTFVITSGTMGRGRAADS